MSDVMEIYQLMRSFIYSVLVSCSVLLFGTCTGLGQVDPGGAGSSFGLINQEMAKGLMGKGGTAEGSGIVKRAAADLAGTPHAVPRIHMEGTLPHQGIYDQSRIAVADFPVMRELAMAYRMTGDTRYLNALDGYLAAWSSTYKVSLNPIDETNMDNIIIAYDLTKDALPDTTRQQMNQFLRQMAEGYAGAVVKTKGDAGNWQSHRIKLLTLSAYALGDEGLIGKAHAAFTQHIQANIRPDGSVFDYYKRDALHYVLYDLEPLTVACLAAKMHGADWFDEGAPGSVAKANDWLTPFETGRQTHVEFVHSSVKFDQTRAKAGIGEYAAHPWEPKASVGLLTLAAAVDPARKALCEQVASATGRKPTDWVVLLFWQGHQME